MTHSIVTFTTFSEFYVDSTKKIEITKAFSEVSENSGYVMMETIECGKARLIHFIDLTLAMTPSNCFTLSKYRFSVSFLSISTLLAASSKTSAILDAK